MTAHLPTSLPLGVRLPARRPGRAAPASAGTAATAVMVAAVLTWHTELNAAPDSVRFGPREVRTDQSGQVLLAVTLARGHCPPSTPCCSAGAPSCWPGMP
ncbi:hypothetical protein ACH4U3_12915 [Streptomyces griseoruber]|uniref:hypothetical protein n=1 Tax=Streptomyces griseoruber TaxID=1943 RepID=UPI0037A03156